MSERVSIARDGKVIAESSNEEVLEGLESGRFLPGDHFFVAGMKEWRALSTFEERKSRSHGPEWDSAQSGARHQVKSRGKRGPGRIPGLVLPLAAFCALLLLAAVGLGTWVALLDSENARLLDEVAGLKKEIAGYAQRISLSDATKEEPPGWVAGRIEINPRGGRAKSVAGGVEVALFEKHEIETYLDSMAEQRDREIKQVQAQIGEAEGAAGGADAGKVKGLREQLAAIQSPAYFLKALPAALRNTVTDSNGQFRLEVPESGDCVLCSRLQSPDPSDPTGGTMLWFIAIRGDRKPNSPVVLNEYNRTLLFSPGFFIQRVD